jgi:prepilin-type N-terminal cleavage/methylation domain-containing protein
MHLSLCGSRGGPPFRAAFSMPEMLVAVGIGGIVLAAVCALTLFSARSFVAIGNYIELDQASRNALDHLSLSIRQTAGLKRYSSTSLTFTNLDNSELVVTWNPGTRKVTQSQGGTTRTLLSECDFLQFNISQRNPSNGVFGFYPASNPDTCKLVDMSWRCSRTMLGKKFHTESVQTAKIVIRN